MSVEERNILASLIGETLINGYFAHAVWQLVASGAHHAPNAVTTWAQLVIWVIPVGIGVAIAAVILGNILAGILGLETSRGIKLDERDSSILIKGMAVTMVVAAVAFIIALVALASGASAFTGLNIIFFGFGAAAMAGDVAKLLMYRVFG